MAACRWRRITAWMRNRQGKTTCNRRRREEQESAIVCVMKQESASVCVMMLEIERDGET